MVVKKLTLDDCHPRMLAKFNRYQETRPWWQKIDGEWVLKDDSLHIDDWDIMRKTKEIEEYINVLQKKGIIIGAYNDENLIGVSVIPNRFWGINNDYLQLDAMHVSWEYRGKGIGRELFQSSCAAAREMGASRLYISAHPSKETQAFYYAVGCYDVTEVIQELLERQPLDRHLEYDLVTLPNKQ